MLRPMVALFVDDARRRGPSCRHLFARFVYCFDQLSKHRLSTALIDHLHRLSTASIRLVITIYLLHLLTRLEARRHVEMARLPPKPHTFSPPSSAAFTNHLHRLPTASTYCLYQVSNYRLSNAFADRDRGGEDTSKRRAYHLNRIPFLPHPWLPLQTTCTAYLLPLPTASIKSVITVYLLHLPTRIEARTHTKTASLQAEKHAFSPPSPTVYLNHLHRLPTASIKSATIVYLMHLPRDRGENAHQIGIPTGRNACIFSPIPNCLHDVNYAHSIAYTQSRLAQ